MTVPGRRRRAKNTKARPNVKKTGRKKKPSIMLAYAHARAIACALKLQSRGDWREFAASGLRPPNVPSNPSRTYKDDGWVSWGHWLGTGNTSTQNMYFRPYGDARRFASALGLQTSRQWHAYSRSGARPSDVPSNPQVVYRDAGWSGMFRWLGTGTAATTQPMAR